jgi:serine/threonine-protein kinase
MKARASRVTIEDNPGGPLHRCPSCAQSFSGDACFCPFDGERLLLVEGEGVADEWVGKLVDGRYDVEAVLGQGGMGRVYAVRHRALGKRFALKMMRSELAEQGDVAMRFLQEARAAALIKHPNVIEITDFGQVEGKTPYFVMELLDGRPLSKLLREGGPPPIAAAVRMIEQMAHGLGAAHAAGVIHRDLKPDNIHVTASGAVKILDFGVAKVAGAARLTRAGIVFGTPHYMSPEQASGAAIDHRADIYAFGIIMYEMFTGKVPFEADSYMGVLTKHMFMEPEPMTAVYGPARQLGALEDVALKCLEKSPAARYATIQELLDEMAGIVRFVGERLEITRPSRRPRRRSDAAPGLADQLEFPAPGELDLPLAAAGLPQKRAWVPGVVALLAVALLLGVGVWTMKHVAARQAEQKPVRGSNQGDVLVSEAPAAVVQPAAPPLDSSNATPSPPGSLAPPPTAARAQTQPRGARGPLPTQRSLSRDGKAPSRATMPSDTDIVNPWSK